MSHDAVALELLLHAALTADSRAIDEPFAVVTDARRREFAYTVYRGIDDDGLPCASAEPALAPRESSTGSSRTSGALRRDADRIPAAMLALAAGRALAARPHDRPDRRALPALARCDALGRAEAGDGA